MIEPLECLGFSAASETGFDALARRLAPDCERYPVGEAAYLRWKSRNSPAELWLQEDERGRIVDATPHFAGDAVMRVVIEEAVTLPDATSLDGAFYAWTNPLDDTASGDVPLVFDCPDFRLAQPPSLPWITTAHVVGYAANIEAFDSLESFRRESLHDVGPQAWQPAGLFDYDTSSLEPIVPPQPFAIVTGHVVSLAWYTNEVTGNEFCAAGLATFGGSLDLLCVPSSLNAPITEGGLVWAACWLTGRLCYHGPARPLDD